MIKPIDYIDLTKDFMGMRLDEAVQKICEAVINKQNEIVADYNKRFKVRSNNNVKK